MAAEVSEKLLSDLRAGRLLLRQKPGPKNALGLVKFVFPNEYGVFMHDTPAKSLFARARRDLSHGCIRLENAGNLAEWLLRDQPGWPRDRIRDGINDAMQGSETLSVKLQHPIPVMTTYLTAVVLENGEVHFFEDIYGEDAALDKELASTSAEPGPHPRE